MNIFIIDSDPVEAARLQCDSHVVKMPLESAQMLSTVHRMLDGTPKLTTTKTGRKKCEYVMDQYDDILYKTTHVNHPCTVWARESKANYEWLYLHFLALVEEYTHRYGKVHLSQTKLEDILASVPENIPDIGLTDFALGFQDYPECVVAGDPVQSYRNFYKTKKAKMKMNWTKRETPEWFHD